MSMSTRMYLFVKNVHLEPNLSVGKERKTIKPNKIRENWFYYVYILERVDHSKKIYLKQVSKIFKHF